MIENHLTHNFSNINSYFIFISLLSISFFIRRIFLMAYGFSLSLIYFNTLSFISFGVIAYGKTNSSYAVYLKLQAYDELFSKVQLGFKSNSKLFGNSIFYNYVKDYLLIFCIKSPHLIYLFTVNVVALLLNNFISISF